MCHDQPVFVHDIAKPLAADRRSLRNLLDPVDDHIQRHHVRISPLLLIRQDLLTQRDDDLFGLCIHIRRYQNNLSFSRYDRPVPVSADRIIIVRRDPSGAVHKHIFY